MAEVYALTEFMPTAIIGLISGQYKECTVGVPLPYVEVRVTDVDTGQGSFPRGEVGVPDARQREAVKAWVVLRADQQLTHDELHFHCRETLVGYKVPRFVEFRDNLPVSHVGKVLRRELAAGERRADARSRPEAAT